MLLLSRRNFLVSSAVMAASSTISQALPDKKSSDKQDKKLGVALLGLGGYSEYQLAPGLELTQHCELRGLVTGSPEKIPRWQKKYPIADKNIYSYTTMDQLANNKDIDIVYVVTPTGTHLEFVVAAANAGKHVWCEKPMAMTVEECQTMIDVCQKNKVRLAIGYRMQHEPNTQTLIGYAQSKPYGKMQSVISQAGYAGGAPDPRDWRLSKKMGGGALYDMGVYSINGARYATGMEPIAVTARHENTRPQVFTEVDETTYLNLEFQNGLIAECATSVGINFNVLRVNCEKGWYELSPMQAYNGVQGKTSDGKKLDKKVVHQQAKQMDDDAFAILSNKDLLVPGEEGLRDIRIVEATLEAARTGTRVLI